MQCSGKIFGDSLKVVATPPLLFPCGSAIGMRRKTVPSHLQRTSSFGKAWQFITHLASSLEAITLIPVVAVIVFSLLLYRLITRGYHDSLFNSK
jgi:hypothetical protein